jgi:hypothetical protein
VSSNTGDEFTNHLAKSWLTLPILRFIWKLGLVVWWFGWPKLVKLVTNNQVKTLLVYCLSCPTYHARLTSCQTMCLIGSLVLSGFLLHCFTALLLFCFTALLLYCFNAFTGFTAFNAFDAFNAHLNQLAKLENSSGIQKLPTV